MNLQEHLDAEVRLLSQRMKDAPNEIRSELRGSLARTIAFIREAVEGMKERERKHYDKIDKDLELSHHSRGYCNDNCRSGGIKKDSEFNAGLDAILEILK